AIGIGRAIDGLAPAPKIQAAGHATNGLHIDRALRIDTVGRFESLNNEREGAQTRRNGSQLRQTKALIGAKAVRAWTHEGGNGFGAPACARLAWAGVLVGGVGKGSLGNDVAAEIYREHEDQSEQDYGFDKQQSPELAHGRLLRTRNSCSCEAEEGLLASHLVLANLAKRVVIHCSRRHGPEGQLSATRFLRHESAIERDGNSNNRVVTGIEAFQTPDARRWRIPLGKESRGGHRLGGCADLAPAFVCSKICKSCKLFCGFFRHSNIQPEMRSGPRNPQRGSESQVQEGVATAPSLDNLKSRAEDGDAKAQFSLAVHYLRSNPAAPDYGSAIKWLRASASQGNTQAQFFLGYLYQAGEGIDRDFAKAAENYQAAAEHGYAPAANNLAYLYDRGQGVPKDLRKAVELYLVAAQTGNYVAQFNLGTMYYRGDGVPRDYSLAAKWFRAAAEEGDAYAQHNLGFLYFKGLGVPCDYKESARWERLAAEQGELHAQTDLGYLYESGRGVPLDYVAAYTWYARAIAGGYRVSVDRRKSLSRIMTKRQMEESNTLVAAETS